MAGGNDVTRTVVIHRQAESLRKKSGACLQRGRGELNEAKSSSLKFVRAADGRTWRKNLSQSNAIASANTHLPSFTMSTDQSRTQERKWMITRRGKRGIMF